MLFFFYDILLFVFFFFFSSRRRHTRLQGDWSSDVCSSDLRGGRSTARAAPRPVPGSAVTAEMSSQLITGATVWAGPAGTPQRAWLLLDGGRIAGTSTTSPPPAADQVLDLPGCHVLPGFTDVHLHLTQAAWYPHGGDAWRWRGLADALDAVRAAAAAESAAPWLLFWDAARWRWPEGRLPTAGELDAAAPGRAVLISTADMHRGAVSPAGLAAAGLPARGPAGEYGDDITRDRRGRPT